VGLLRNERVSASMVAFVLLVMAAVIFDGVLATPAWPVFEGALLAPFAPAGDLARMVARTLGLVGVWLVFLGAYGAICRIMAAAADGQLAAGAIARRFVFTLVPIVIAYHLAHYLSFLLIQGQYAIPLASDPFGRGWDLFDTAGYRVDIAVVGARFAWYLAVIAIVVGHIVAVFLAHVQAMVALPSRRPALRSQVPMTALMVVFTVISLSILAEPIVERAPAAAATATPRSAVAVAVPAENRTASSACGPPRTGTRTRLMSFEPRCLTTAISHGASRTTSSIVAEKMVADLARPSPLVGALPPQPKMMRSVSCSAEASMIPSAACRPIRTVGWMAVPSGA
jgi:hypothetical protein